MGIDAPLRLAHHNLHLFLSCHFGKVRCKREFSTAADSMNNSMRLTVNVPSPEIPILCGLGLSLYASVGLILTSFVTHRSKEKREEEMSGESKGVPIPDSLHESTRNWQLVHLHGFHGDRSFGRESKGVKD